MKKHFAMLLLVCLFLTTSALAEFAEPPESLQCIEYSIRDGITLEDDCIMVWGNHASGMIDPEKERNPPARSYIAVYEADGSERWSQDFGNPNFYNEMTSVGMLPDGNILLFINRISGGWLSDNTAVILKPFFRIGSGFIGAGAEVNHKGTEVFYRVRRGGYILSGSGNTGARLNGLVAASAEVKNDKAAYAGFVLKHEYLFHHFLPFL